MLSPSQTCVADLAGPLRFFGRVAAALGNQFGDLGKTLRVTRHQEQQQDRECPAGESVEDQRFLAFASTGGEPDRAGRAPAARAPSCSFSGAGVTSNLRLPQTLTWRRRAAANARRRPPSARQRRSAPPALARSGLQPAIAALRASRQAGVDQRHRQLDVVGPRRSGLATARFPSGARSAAGSDRENARGIRQVVGQVSLRQPSGMPSSATR
jgi:hypothetical protein